MRPTNVIPFPVRQIGGGVPPRQVDGRGRLLKPIVCAAGALVLTGIIACVAVVFMSVKKPSQHPLMGSFSTAKGEHGCWELPDGSELCLNTDSEVRYTFAQSARNLEVLSGEAVFTVHKDARPFEVLSGGLLVRDISTRFGVYRKGPVSTLTVIEGSVRAKAPINRQTQQEFELAQPLSGWDTAPLFQRLQQVEFDENSGALNERLPLTATSLSQSLAWQHGQIDPAGRTLREVLEEFARFQPIDKFNIPDEGLAQSRNFAGEFNARNLTSFLDALANVYGIQHTMTRDPSGATIVNLSRSRHPPRK